MLHSSMDLEDDISLKGIHDEADDEIVMGKKLKVESLELTVSAKQHFHRL